MRIALFTDTYIPFINGVSSSVDTLRRQLEKNNHQVFIITTNAVNSYIEFSDNCLRIPGLLLKKLYGYRMSWIYSAKAMKYVKKMNLDLIHTHSEYGIGIFAKICANKLNLPLVYTYHTMYEDYTHYITKGHFDYIAKNLVYRLSRYYASSCTELISPSFKTKEALRRYGVTKYINVIPTGIDLEKFDSSKSTKEQILKLRRSIGIQDDTFVVVYLGRIAAEKNIELLLHGFKQVLGRTGRNEVMLVVGDGPQKAELEILSASLGISDKVIFTGKVPLTDVPIYYHLSDVFASASLSETQGLTYIEALASGIPVLACYDKNLDMLKDGETGYFFTDEESFATSIIKIATMEEAMKQKMSKSIKDRAEDFSATFFYQRIKVVYQRAIRAKW